MTTKKKRHLRRRKLANINASRSTANCPKSFTITSQVADLQLEAAASDEGGKPKVRSFSMTAYTGGAMMVAGYGLPVVVDLSGMEVRSQSRPILYSHDQREIVGHSEKIDVTQQTVKVSGKVSGIGASANEVTALADNGFPWQASIGCSVAQLEYVEQGNKVKVNGRNVDGPVYVARKTSLREISFAALGADDNTSASIAASQQKDCAMNEFEKWLVASGFVKAELSESQLSALRATFDKANELDDEEDNSSRSADLDVVASTRAALAAEAQRVADIQATVNKYGVRTITVDNSEVDLAAHAIASNWSIEKTELAALRASRPTGPAIHVSSGVIPNQQQVIEAAICINANFPSVEKAFKPEILEAADKHYRRISLKQVFLMAAAANGYVCRPGDTVHQGNLREVLEFAFPPRGIRAASTLSVGTILTSVANKELLEGYMEDNEEWREISQVKSVSDLKQVTSYRLLDNMEYEELPADGQIKHGTVDQESYTRQAKTYAKMFALTRTDILNDDLGAFDDIRVRLGRGGKRKFNNIFWAAFMNNASFFTSGRGNYISGSTTNLGTNGVGLELGVTAFRKMKSPTADGAKKVGNSVGGRPDRLLVPPELEFIADRLYASAFVQSGATDSMPDANIHANKYRPIVVDWLSDSAYTGNSATAWYLFRNPADMAPMAVSFLNGVQTPTIESSDADFNTLGVQMRGYHDWGCDQADYLAGIKSKGAA